MEGKRNELFKSKYLVSIDKHTNVCYINSMNAKRELTHKQAKIFDYIRNRIWSDGYPPTIREIAKSFGYSSLRTVQVHLEAMEKKGWIRKRKGLSRGLELIDAESGTIPVIGRISAGSPLLAIENRDGELPIKLEYKDFKNRFALRVNGDSMIGAGICNDDYCIVRMESEVRCGDVVVAILGEEATVKRLAYFDECKVVLAPENPDFDPIECRSDEITICGIVEGVWREIK